MEVATLQMSIFLFLRCYITNVYIFTQKIIVGGGLSNSPYVFSKLHKWASQLGLKLSRPGGPIEKAVTSGALSWYLDGSVSSRVAKFHYGTNVSIPFDRSDPEITCRESEKYQDVFGEWKIDGAWSEIVEKASNFSSFSLIQVNIEDYIG